MLGSISGAQRAYPFDRRIDALVFLELQTALGDIRLLDRECRMAL
jgi:hypothetical protein